MDKIKPEQGAFKNVPTESQNITADKLSRLLPKGSKANITNEIVKLANNMGSDCDLPQELMEEELLGYMHMVGKIPGIGVEDLIRATKYCNLKRNYDNKRAWSIVYPEKYDKLIEEKRQVDSHVSMYNNSKLVRAIDKELLIPAHLQYAPYFHAAVKKQFSLMNGNGGLDNQGEKMTVSPMVQHLAAKELALITKQPEETKIDIKVEQSDAMVASQNEMNVQLAALVDAQARRFRAGDDTADIQKVHTVNIIEAETE